MTAPLVGPEARKVGDVGEFLAALLADFLGGAIGRRSSDRARVRRTARAIAAGRDASFPGWVLGRQTYCRAAGGVLTVTPDAVYHLLDRGMPITRHDLPAERLAVIRRRPGTWEDHKHMPENWAVLECLDGDEPILIGCHEAEMPHVEEALRRLA